MRVVLESFPSHIFPELYQIIFCFSFFVCFSHLPILIPAVFLRHFIYYLWTKGALGEKITLGLCPSHFHLQFGVRIWSLSLSLMLLRSQELTLWIRQREVSKYRKRNQAMESGEFCLFLNLGMGLLRNQLSALGFSFMTVIGSFCIWTNDLWNSFHLELTI